MQLPQNKKERQKILGLIAVGVVAVLYGIWAGIYSPIKEKKEAAMSRIVELEDKIMKAERQIRRIPLAERELQEVMTNLVAKSGAYMLYPRLGNYLLPVREKLGGLSARHGISALQVDEISLVALPRGAQSPVNPAMQLYGVRVSAECGYEDLRQWFSTMEEENPLVSIGNIVITARPGNPLQHQVTFELYFPVWTDPDYDEQLREDLAALEAGAE